MRTHSLTLLFCAVLGLPVNAATQTPADSPPAQGPAAAVDAPVASEPALEAPVEPAAESRRRTRPVLRIGQDFALTEGDVVREVAVILGAATIAGRVERDVVVVFGPVQLSSTASIDGSLVVIGGSPTVASGALVDGDVVVVGGGFDPPAGFISGGQHIVIGSTPLGANLEAAVPWVTRGLLWGRLIVPDLPWVWGIVGIVFFVYLALNLVFDQAVRSSAGMLVERPLTTFMVGLLVLLLTGPVSFLLAVSVVGIAVVPFVLCALLVAWLIGRIGVLRWIGMRAMPQESPDSRLQSVRSFVLGFAVVGIAYAVPVLGIIVWAMVGVFGLGAATLAFIVAFRQEQPARRPPLLDTRARGPVPPGESPVPPSTAYGETNGPQLPGGTFSSGDTAAGPFGPTTSAVMAAPTDLAAFPHASFLERLAAFVLDVILVVIAYQMLDLTRREGAMFLLLLAYHIGFWAWKGTTVGGIICQLRVVRVDGSALRFVDALVRGLSSIFSLAVLGLGGIWILIDPERQAWHDKIAGTYVVKVPRHWPL